MEAPDRGARLGNGRICRRTCSARTPSGRSSCAATASRCASSPSPARIFPRFAAKTWARMLHLLLVYALEHPDQNTKTQLLAAAPSLWQEENKIQG